MFKTTKKIVGGIVSTIGIGMIYVGSSLDNVGLAIAAKGTEWLTDVSHRKFIMDIYKHRASSYKDATDKMKIYVEEDF